MARRRTLNLSSHNRSSHETLWKEIAQDGAPAGGSADSAASRSGVSCAPTLIAASSRSNGASSAATSGITTPGRAFVADRGQRAFARSGSCPGCLAWEARARSGRRSAEPRGSSGGGRRARRAGPARADGERCGVATRFQAPERGRNGLESGRSGLAPGAREHPRALRGAPHRALRRAGAFPTWLASSRRAIFRSQA